RSRTAVLGRSGDLSGVAAELAVPGDEPVPVFPPEGLLRPNDVTRSQELRPDAGERLCQRRRGMGVPRISAMAGGCSDTGREDLERHVSEGERGEVPFDRLTVPCAKRGAGRRVVQGYLSLTVPAAEPDHGTWRWLKLGEHPRHLGRGGQVSLDRTRSWVLLADGKLQQEDGLHGRLPS